MVLEIDEQPGSAELAGLDGLPPWLPELQNGLQQAGHTPVDTALQLSNTPRIADQDTGQTGMRTIGLLGGMSWESTVVYYRLINQAVGATLGGLHSARILLYSVDFHDMNLLQAQGRWDDAGQLLGDAAARLEKAGADLLVLCTNTMHKVAPRIEASINIPLLHIADATARQISEQGFTRVGLLGTRFTMEEDFYRNRLESDHGFQVIVPAADDRTTVHRVIYEELCRGQIRDASRDRYRQIIRALADDGAQCIILGCTEIGLLIRPEDVALPLFDTTAIHAQYAAMQAVKD